MSLAGTGLGYPGRSRGAGSWPFREGACNRRVKSGRPTGARKHFVTMNKAVEQAGIEHPLVTTVVPTYRRPRLLKRAISSALAQGSFTCVSVFDNCSGDETADVVARVAAGQRRVQYHVQPRNLGALANFEFGVRSVKTPFFSILSDDDYLLPGFYERALAGLEAHPEAMFWVGVTLNVDTSGCIWDARLTRWKEEGLYLPPAGALAMTGGKAPTWTGIVFRREVLDLVGFLDPEALGPSDFDYTIRLGALLPFVFERVPVAVFTINPEGFSETQPLASFWPGWLKMLANVQHHAGLGEEAKLRLLAALNRDAKRMLFRRGVNALAAGRIDFANDAADVLLDHYELRLKPAILRSLASACLGVPGFQRALSCCYRMLERSIVHSRSQLRDKYAHLLLAP